ncbi:MAG: RNA polymerase sigma factor [Planctomycetota bacterium]
MSGICEEEAIAIERCRRGSPDAFEVIVRRYMKRAYFIALGLVGNRDDALDLSQEAFFRAYDNIDHLHSDRKFFPWFYQILKNLCFTHLRKKSRRQTTTLDNIDDQEVTTENNAAFDPEAIAERGELKKQVWKAIGKLGDKHREVIILRHFQNLSYDQMADVLFCSKGTVMSRLYHARRKLKDLLDSEKGGQ